MVLRLRGICTLLYYLLYSRHRVGFIPSHLIRVLEVRLKIRPGPEVEMNVAVS